MRTACLAATVLTCAAVFSETSHCKPPGPLPLQKALTIAEAKTTGLTLLLSRPETGRWGFYFMTSDGTIIEKEIHASTGRILVDKRVTMIQNHRKLNPKVIDALRERARVKLSNNQYLRIALDKFGGLAMGFEILLKDEDRLDVQVSGELDGDSWEALMDMGTGKLR